MSRWILVAEDERALGEMLCDNLSLESYHAEHVFTGPKALERMAAGMTGHLDEWYPEVCGDRNAWLGGDGDTWERGPYWIDGLYPLARLLKDETLIAKAMPWIEWTLANQRDNGQ